jgi:hypothetical protein
MMDRFTIGFDATRRMFYIAPHFYDRLHERSDHKGLRDSMLNSIYIAKRPNSLTMLIKHGLRAFYLWDEANKLVYVIQEDRHAKRMSVLKTVYPSSECDWLLIWQAQNPKNKRTRFHEVFHIDEIFQ